MQVYFKQNGIETEVIQRGSYFLLVTKNRFENPEKSGTDGYQMKQTIKRIGAKYKAPDGYERFGSTPFQDAYGMKKISNRRNQKVHYRSLKVKGALSRHRNVLSRGERIEVLKQEDRWEDEKSVMGLPKVAHRKAGTGKKAAKEETAAAAPGAAPAAAAPAAGAAAKK